MEVWVRFDPTTEEAVLEDELGVEQGQVDVSYDAGFLLIGPIQQS